MSEKFHHLLSYFIGLAMVLLDEGKAQEQTTPIRLTGGKDTLFSIPIATMDQCIPHDEWNTFGIEFRLPKQGGDCRNGMRICYPSTLAYRNVNTMHNISEFAVNSELYNNIGNKNFEKECNDMLILVGKPREQREHWRGFSVSTKQRDGQQIIKLEMSILESYEINGANRQFVIHFGNAKEPFTYVTIDFGERIELDPVDTQKRDAYKKLAKRGAPLNDFFGFWSLGMDMMPWTDSNIELNVARMCNCSMEAWFIRPTDAEPEDPKVPTVGAEIECHYSTNKRISFKELKTKMTAEHLFYIIMSTKDGENPWVNFTVWGANATKSEDKKKQTEVKLFHLAMSSNNSFIEFEKENGKPSKIVSIINPLENTTQTQFLEFIFAFTNYSYGIKLNGKFVQSNYIKEGEELFPINWWQKLPFDRMTSFQISANAILLNEVPPLMPFITIDTNYESPIIPLPFFMTIPSVEMHSEMSFKISLDDINKYNFTVSFLHDRPENHLKIGATVLELNFILGHMKFTSYSVEKAEPPETFNLYLTRLTDIKIIAQEGYQFSVTFNENKKTYSLPTIVPIWAVNFIRVKGEHIRLLDRPYLPPKTEKEKKANLNIVASLDTVLNYGDEIWMEMIISETTKKFYIRLMHESVKPSTKIGDILLLLEFDLSKPDISCRNYLHANQNFSIGNNGTHKLNQYGQHFDLLINATAKHFEIRIDQVGFQLDCKYGIPNDFSKDERFIYPPWAVDKIQIESVGGMELKAFKINHTNAKITESIYVRHFARVIDLENGRLLSKDEQINVKIPNKLNGSLKFEIYLLYEGLRFHPIIGKTAMKMIFSGTNALYFSSYDSQRHSKTSNFSLGNFESCKIEEKLDMTKIKQFNIGIHVTDNTGKYKVKFDTDGEVTDCQYESPEMPTWTVQYITVLLTNDPQQLIKPEISCIPQKRCMKMRDVDDLLEKRTSG